MTSNVLSNQVIAMVHSKSVNLFRTHLSFECICYKHLNILYCCIVHNALVVVHWTKASAKYYHHFHPLSLETS